MHAKVSEGAKMSTPELDTDSKYLPQLDKDKSSDRKDD